MTWAATFRHDLNPDDVAAYGRALEALRSFQDAFAAARFDRAAVEALTADLDDWRERLAPLEVDEDDQVFGHVPELDVRGHAFVPAFHATHRTTERVEGTVRFGRFTMGGGMAAHGGAITLMFDEVVGVLAATRATRRCRTAYLNTSFRAITPIDVDLNVVGVVERVEGRKIFVRAELRQGDTLCAETEGLFVELRPEAGLAQ